METELERLDDMLIAIQVQLHRVETLAEHLCRDVRHRDDPALLHTIHRHGEDLLLSSRHTAARLERLCSPARPPS